MKTDEVVIDGALVVRRGATNKAIEIKNNLPEFRTLRGWPGEYDENGTILVSEFLIDGTDQAPERPGRHRFWQIYLVITVSNWHEASGDYDDPEWNVSLKACSPVVVDDAACTAALEASGIHLEDAGDDDNLRHSMVIEALVDYGATAPIADFYSDDVNAAVLAAKQEAILAQSLLSVYMSRQVNAMGSTGWEFIQGTL